MYRKFDVTGNLFYIVHFSMDLNTPWMFIQAVFRW
jgi:hypothetical protein